MNTLTSFDIPTLHRNMIGIDRLLDRMQVVNGSDQGYPPYNVIKQDDNHFSIELALAGFSEKDIDVTVHNGVLTIKGEKDDTSTEDGNDYLHKGIGNRSFRRTFNLADHVEVTNATMNNGILSVTLERDVPEELKPRKIPVTFV
mgnify:CR=1 FL=1